MVTGLLGTFQYSALRKFLLAQKLARPGMWVQARLKPKVMENFKLQIDFSTSLQVLAVSFWNGRMKHIEKSILPEHLEPVQMISLPLHFLWCLLLVPRYRMKGNLVL